MRLQIVGRFTTQAQAEVVVLTDDAWEEVFTWECWGCDRWSDASAEDQLHRDRVTQQAKAHADQCTVPAGESRSQLVA